MTNVAVMATAPNVSQQSSFDLVRLSKSKQAVDLSPNTLREYARRGLNIYRMGKAAFFSKVELERFIRTMQKSSPRVNAD